MKRKHRSGYTARKPLTGYGLDAIVDSSERRSRPKLLMDSHFIAAIDFDGTIVRHAFPRIGAPVPGALEWLKRFQAEGMKLILWTMRCNYGSMGDVLSQAIAFCHANGVEFWGINQNFQQCESGWSTSNKQYAHVYVDDSAAGTPLIYPTRYEARAHGERFPCVDWSLVGPNVMARYEFWKGWETMRKNPPFDPDLPADYGFGPDAPRVELPEPTLIQP